MAIDATATDIIQEVTDARVDMQSFESFMFEPAGVMIPRRLAPDTHSLQHYLDYLNAIKLLFTQNTGNVTVGDKSITAISQQIASAIDKIIKSGGRVGYATHAAMTADAANIKANSVIEITNDTADKNGIYLYNGSTFTKSPYDPIALAKAYTDSRTNIVTAPPIGNVITESNRTVLKDIGLTNAGDYQVRAGVNSQVIPVKAGDVLYLRNNVNNYGQYRQFAFFDANIATYPSATRVPHVTTYRTVGNLTVNRVVVPTGATHLVMNTAFGSDVFSWSVRNTIPTGTESDFTLGSERLSFFSGAKVESTFSDADTILLRNGGINYGELNLPENTLLNTYVLSGGVTKIDTKDWRVVFIEAKQGDVFYFKIPIPINTQYLLGHYTNFNAQTGAFVLGSKINLAYTDMPNVYKFTMPADVNSFVFNIKMDNFDITTTASLQQGIFRPFLERKKRQGISGLSGFDFIDHVAMRLAIENSNSKQTNTLANKTIYMFGDSITQGTQGGFTQLIAGATGATVVNMGSSGAYAKRLVGIMTDQPNRQSGGTTFVAPDYTNIDIVTIMIGTNDLTHPFLAEGVYSARWGDVIDVPTDTVYDYVDHNEYFQKFPDSFFGNVGLCIEYVRWRNPNCKIYIISPPYAYAAGNRLPSLQLEAILQKISAYFACEFIPATTNSGVGFKDMHSTKGKYSYDGTHLNTLGNKVFSDYLVRKLR